LLTEVRKGYSMSAGKLKGRDHFVDLGTDGIIIIIIIIIIIT
jgi:hypothetical protein